MGRDLKPYLAVLWASKACTDWLSRTRPIHKSFLDHQPTSAPKIIVPSHHNMRARNEFRTEYDTMSSRPSNSSTGSLRSDLAQFYLIRWCCCFPKGRKMLPSCMISVSSEQVQCQPLALWAIALLAITQVAHDLLVGLHQSDVCRSGDVQEMRRIIGFMNSSNHITLLLGSYPFQVLILSIQQRLNWSKQALSVIWTALGSTRRALLRTMI